MAVYFKGKYLIPSTRLQYWDYSSDGWYFITICTKNREQCFGSIQNGSMVSSKIGNIVVRYWNTIPNHFSFVQLDAFVVMPDHVHGILIIDHNDVGDNNPHVVETRQCLVSTNMNANVNMDTNIGKNRFQNQGKNTISSIIGSYKAICTKMINKLPVIKCFAWQSRFHDHIIRTDIELNNIRAYIKNNPLHWELKKNKR